MIAVAALLTMAAWAFIEAGRGRLVGWALYYPDEAAPLFAELAERRPSARRHAALVIATWPVTLRHLPTANDLNCVLGCRSSWGMRGVRVITRYVPEAPHILNPGART